MASPRMSFFSFDTPKRPYTSCDGVVRSRSPRQHHRYRYSAVCEQT